MIERTLGDVPGIDDLVRPSRALLPGDYTVYETNAFGDVTSDMSYLGDLAGGVTGSGDPFAYDVGFLDEPSAGPGAVRDPMRSSHLPPVEHYYDSGTSTVPVPSSGAPVTASDGSEFTADQVANAQAIVETGKEVGATDRDIQVAIMAAMVESNLQNLDYGDRDSIGMFQQRDAWGSREDRLDPHKAARMFFLGGVGGQQGLLDIPDRENRTLGDLAQDVQVSAYPERYAEREGAAAALLGSLPGPGQTTTGQSGSDPYATVEVDGEIVDNLTAAALEAAKKEFGGEFSIMQGGHSSYSGSGGTHEGLGVVDITVPDGDWVGAMTALRKIGFAAWVRNVPGFGQAGDGAHIHAVLIGDEQLSPEALQQVQSYLNNDDGLRGSRADDGPRQYVNNRFEWGKPEKDAPKPRPAWAEQVIRQAKTFLGTPFKWGGEDYDGVDAIGFVRNVYSRLGIDIPVGGLVLADLPEPVDVQDAQPGDLIAWDRHPETGTSHVGILVDKNLIASADMPGRVVQLNTLGDVTTAYGIPIWPLLHRKQEERRRHPAAPAAPARDPYTAGDAPHGITQPPSAPSAPATAPSSGGGSHSGGGGGGQSNNPTPNHDIRTGAGGQGGGVYIP